MGCDSFKKDFIEGYEKSFSSRFKSSFMSSCIRDNYSELKEKLCSCIGNDLLENLDSSELSDVDLMGKYVIEASGPRCLEKHVEHQSKSTKASSKT